MIQIIKILNTKAIQNGTTFYPVLYFHKSRNQQFINSPWKIFLRDVFYMFLSFKQKPFHISTYDANLWFKRFKTLPLFLTLIRLMIWFVYFSLRQKEAKTYLIFHFCYVSWIKFIKRILNWIFLHIFEG